MNIHEYQAKELLKAFGVPVLKGGVAYTPEEAEQVAKGIGGSLYVVKAQIHAGGRGKGRFTDPAAGDGGGIRVVSSLGEVRDNAARMLGQTLTTHQTGPEGRAVNRLYIESGCDIKRELYLSMLVDRSSSKIAVVVSTEGGTDIESVAAKAPEKIIAQTIDPVVGLCGFHGRKIAFSLGLEGKQISAFGKLLTALYKAFVERDMALLEINPLVTTAAGDVVPLDCKISFDDNALFRHPDILDLRDEDEEDPAEIEASKHSLNYVKLNGTIGCMVNGAGLAMATMDIIQLYGGMPANFLDVGGGATKERVIAAFKIILSDPNVEGILLNIFGGIMRCDVIAEGVVAAAREVGLNVPLVVRLEGTNMELGRKIMASSGLNIIAANDLADAAEKITAAVKEASQ